MTDREFPKEVRTLIRRLNTMEEVETLLLLADDAGPLTAGEIRARLRLPASDLPSAAMGRLMAENLVIAEDGADPIRYRFCGTADTSRAVDMLRAAYNERPVTLVRLIYNRVRTAESFTDAFRSNEDDMR